MTGQDNKVNVGTILDFIMTYEEYKDKRKTFEHEDVFLLLGRKVPIGNTALYSWTQIGSSSAVGAEWGEYFHHL